MRALAGILGYVVILIAVTWINPWWFTALAFASPLVATVFAARNYEYWPVAHPVYGFFWAMPALLAAWSLLFNHPLEWGQWLMWSLLLAVAITAAWTMRLRKYIDREWAVIGTFGAVFALGAFGLNVANNTVPGQTHTFEVAAMLSSSPGGYRQLARLTVETPTGGRETFYPGLLHYYDLEGAPLCVVTYSGALGWRWTMLDQCTSEEIAAATRS